MTKRSNKEDIVMRKASLFCLFCISSLLFFHSAPAQAQTKNSVAASLAIGTIFPIPVPFEGQGASLLLVPNAGISIPLDERWLLNVRAAFATSFTAFQPAPQTMAGVGVQLKRNALSLNLMGVYRYVPHWKDAPSDGHVAGAALVPALISPSRISLLFPVGFACNVTVGTCSPSLGIDIAFRLSVP